MNYCESQMYAEELREKYEAKTMGELQKEKAELEKQVKALIKKFENDNPRFLINVSTKIFENESEPDRDGKRGILKSTTLSVELLMQ